MVHPPNPVTLPSNNPNAGSAQGNPAIGIPSSSSCINI